MYLVLLESDKKSARVLLSCFWLVDCFFLFVLRRRHREKKKKQKSSFVF